MFAATWRFFRSLSACSGIYLPFLLFLLHSFFCSFNLLFLSSMKWQGKSAPTAPLQGSATHSSSSIDIKTDIKAGILPSYVMSTLAHSASLVKHNTLPGIKYRNVFLYFNICFSRISSLASVNLHLISSVVNTDFHLIFKAFVPKLFILSFLSECYQYPCSCGFPSDKEYRCDSVQHCVMVSNIF